MTDVRIRNVLFDNSNRRLSIDWHDDLESHFSFIQLRHDQNYPVLGRPEQADDAPCHIPEAPQLPLIESYELIENQLKIHWKHDSGFTLHNALQLRKLNGEKSPFYPTLWDGQVAQNFEWFDYSDLKHDQRLLEIFCHLRSHGIALLRDLPIQPDTLFEIADYFGPVRRTHFGEIFDIRSLPPDQAGTGANIGATASNSQAPHMDEGWRHGPPGMSFFHCLSASRKGGSSQFVDGIAAAEELRKAAIDSFQFLTNTPLLMAAERNPQERFRNRGRVIASDYSGIVRGVRVSDRNFPPIDYLPPHLIEPAYQAMHDFAKCVYAEKAIFDIHVKPGELVIFDNHRVLHARRAFDVNSGERRIQQLSVDREEFQNVFRQLGEKLGNKSVIDWEPDAGLLSQPVY